MKNSRVVRKSNKDSRQGTEWHCGEPEVNATGETLEGSVERTPQSSPTSGEKELLYSYTSH